MATKAVLALALAAAVGAGLWWSQRDDGAPAGGEARASPQPALAGAAVGPVMAQAPALAASLPLQEPINATALASQTPVQAVRGLLQCHAANTCRVTSREGLDEHFEIVGALMQQIERLQAQGNPAEQSALVRELLAFPDGHVQAAALALAAKLPPSTETVSAAVAALGKTYDAVLLDKAYPVLRQWQQLGLTAGYDEMFVGLVHTGGWQAAQSVAENVGPFLNAGNVARFEQVARELQPGARQQALLRSLRDYQLQRQGG
ncbi:hypothetical protein [Roseateles asaccharophilus]|uniref:Uncharacterized protein n=1 Tax=Roseateles asaccharophilus TaxID=582607 RepID=A0ABU2ADV7_9BURK|nr:hypothetical protein [Roseateles asaccharophilus]MDR7335386.1 hypothetical protein [Roseateles asaccharophilus]